MRRFYYSPIAIVFCVFLVVDLRAQDEKKSDAKVRIEKSLVYGKGGDVPPGGTESQPLELFIGNAGTAARFLSAFVCLGRGVYRIHGIPRMNERPKKALFQALKEGLRFVWQTPLLWSSMLLDFFATFFSSALLLLPVYADQILHAGVLRLGLGRIQSPGRFAQLIHVL